MNEIRKIREAKNTKNKTWKQSYKKERERDRTRARKVER